MYKVTEEGEVISQYFDSYNVAYAFGQGWTTMRPPPMPTFNRNGATIGGNRIGLQEAVGLMYLGQLSMRPGTAPQQPYIIKVEPSNTFSPSGNPRFLVTWGMRGEDPSLWGGGMGGPSGAMQLELTDEITLLPSDRNPGQYEVIPTHQEPGLLLPGLAQSIQEGTVSYGNVDRADARVASVFERMYKGTLSPQAGFQELNALIGYANAFKLHDQAMRMMEAQLQRAGAEFPTGTLPRAATYGIFGLNQFFTDFNRAMDPRFLEGLGQPDLDYESNFYGPGVKDPRIVDNLLAQATEFAHANAVAFAGLSYDEQQAFISSPGFAELPLAQQQQFLGASASEWENMTPLEQQIWQLNQNLQAQNGAAATYQAPDRATIYDQVKAKLISLIGVADPARINILTDLYMRTDQERFNGGARDPGQVVIDAIRLYPEYQRVHALRPDFIDEADWLSYQFQGLMNAGMRNSAIERRAITQATAGVSPARAGEAGQVFELMETGQMLPTFLQRMRNSLSGLSRLMP